MNKYQFKKATKGKKIIKQYFDKYGYHTLVFEDNKKYQIRCTYDGLEYDDVTKKIKGSSKQLWADLMLLTPKYVEQMKQKYSQNIENILNL